MTPLPVGPRDVLALARYARVAGTPRGPLLVTGVLAAQLAKELGAGADPGVVRTEGDPAHAAALVHVVASSATPEGEALLRLATRALVPVVVVQTGDPATRLPYVLATDVVDCEPGKGFPIDRIARALAAALGGEGSALASELPVLRDAVQDRRVEEGALSAAALASLGADAPRLPVLTLAQSRMASDVTAAAGGPRPEALDAAARAVGPQLAAALGTGLVARALVRRLPVRNRLVDAVIAAAATYALGTAFRRIGRS